MKDKKARCNRLAALLIFHIMTWLFSSFCVFAGENDQLPHLIQTTTLEEDYRAITSLGLAQTPVLLEEDPQEAFERILCSCVRIQARGHHGSGSIFRMRENDMIIVTNRHVLEYWDEDSYVTFYGGAAESGRVIGLSEEADVGFLSVPTGRFTWGELLRFRNIRIPRLLPGEDAGKAGTEYFGVDMAADPWHPTMETGKIISFSMYLEDFERKMIYGEGSAVQGMSGSGIFDGYGNYLGMLTGGTPQGEIAAVPAEVIAEEYLEISTGAG